MGTAIMTSWTKTTGAYSASTCIFVALIGLSCGAPPLDVSEFFGSPASSPEEAAQVVPESKIRSAGSTDLSGLEELLAKLGGDQNNALKALATMLNPSQPDEDANGLLSYFGEPDLDKEPEDIITDATVNCRNTGSSKAHCEESKQCYWLEKTKFEGKCIHQTERLYNALYKKLHKRGKKDIAIQVFYKSRPAKVKLPHGLYGPHIIGAFNHLHKLRPYHAPIGYNSYLNSYGYGGYNHYGYGKGYGHGYGGYGKGYGHGYGGYGHGKGGYGHGGYGAPGYGGYGHNKGGYGHNDGYGQGQGYGYENDGDDNKNDTSSNDNEENVQDNDGYSHGNGGYGHGNHGYGHGNGGYGHGNHGNGHGNGGYGHNDGYGHGNGDHGYGNGGYEHDGGYGSTHGGYGHGKDGYGGGHGYSDYSGPTYGHQGHSAGYSSGPSYGSKGYGGYE